MRAWGWVAGVVVVLVGAVVVIGVVGAPRGTDPERKRTPTVVRAATLVPRVEAAARVVGERRTQHRALRQALSPAVRRLERDMGNGLASEIDRQRSAMRAAVTLLVAGEQAGARIR